MAKVLFITANPKNKDQSNSLKVADHFLQNYRAKNSNDEITELNLYKTDIPFIDVNVFSAWGKLQQGTGYDKLSMEEKDIIGRIDKMTDQFMSADKYIFVTPLWNLSVPPKMKAYIDTISIAGKTFKYTENGPVGLMQGRKGIHIQSRGGFYSEGPAREMEFGDRYLKTIMSFLGITMVDSVIIEGIDHMPKEADRIRSEALKRAESAAQTF